MKRLFFSIIGCAAGLLGAEAATPWQLLPQTGQPIHGAQRVDGATAKTRQGQAPQRLGENAPLLPPFVETFDNLRPGMEHDDFDRYFQTIDANNDNRYWGLYNYAEAVPYGRCAYLLYPINADQADDWLVTRAIKLQKGKYYYVCMDTKLYQEGPAHTFEVKYGTYNDPEGMNKMVIDRVEVTGERHKRVSGWICPKLTGLYYLGVHSNTTTKRGYLFVDNITVQAAREPGAPAEVSGVKMTNDPDGTLSVNIEFTAPAVALDGSALTELTKVIVSRDGEVIRTFDAPAPGQTLQLQDVPPTDNYVAYDFVAVNAVGESAPVHIEHRAGLATPVAPKIKSITDIGDNLVRLEWEPVTADVNGNAVNPDKVTYSVSDITDGTEVPLEMELTGTQYTYAPTIEQGGQALMMMMLRAAINGKESEAAVSERIAVGTPFTLPHRHSFTNADLGLYPLGMTNEASGVMWRMLDDYSDPNSQDGDNGFICMIGDTPGQRCKLETGKITLEGALHPMLSFYTYVYQGDQNLIHVWVKDLTDNTEREVMTVQLNQFDRMGWTQISVPLDQYAGHTIRLGIEGHIISHGYVPVDNLSLIDRPAVDLGVRRVDVQSYAYPNDDIEVAALIRNCGSETVSECTVSLLRGDKEVYTELAGPIEPLQELPVLLYDRLSVLSDPTVSYTVRVYHDEDADPTNDESPAAAVSLLVTNYPVPTQLTIAEQGSDVSLTWAAPDLATAAPLEQVEDFESYAHLDTAFGDWTTVDADRGYVGGFDGTPMQGIDRTQQSWWVMSNAAPFDFIPTHSGSNALVQMYAYSADLRDIVQCDDWLISPELYGGTQVLRFYAASLSTEYGYDTFTVLGSTGGKELTDFTELLPVSEPTEDWQEYVVVLPAGTRRFAIRCTSRNTFMMLLDDIRYTPAGEPEALELLGYNIYRNGERLNSEPVSGTAFSTAMNDRGDDYYVTAVYGRGESMASNVANLSSAADITVDPTHAVYYDLQGRRVNPSRLTPGLYLQRQGNTVRKILRR